MKFDSHEIAAAKEAADARGMILEINTNRAGKSEDYRLRSY